MLSLEYSALNASSCSVPKSFLRQISRIALERSTNSHLDWETISGYLKKVITEEWRDLQTLGHKILEILESKKGYVVVKNLPFCHYPRPIIDYLFASLALCLGNLTVHNSSKSVIWDVANRSETCGREPTFSELNTAAPFHTDSAFRKLPEKYFGLWTIKAASDGGNSTAINVEQLIQYLATSTSGRECLEILKSCNFPFSVPPAFAINPNWTEIIEATILTLGNNGLSSNMLGDLPLIRFRLDTIMKGFQQSPELATPQRLWAVKYFDRVLNTYPDKLQFKLNDGDVVFFNNHTMLHGRTAFSDNQRLLLRIRIE